MVFVRPSHPKREAALSWVPLRQRWGYSAQLLNWCHRTLERFTVITRIFTNTKNWIKNNSNTVCQNPTLPQTQKAISRMDQASLTQQILQYWAAHWAFCRGFIKVETGRASRVEVMEWRWGLAGWSCIRCINYWSAESWGGGKHAQWKHRWRWKSNLHISILDSMCVQLHPVPNELGEISASASPCLIAAALCTWQTNLWARGLTGVIMISSLKSIIKT